MAIVSAQFYDGRSARRREVRLSAVGDTLIVETELGEESFSRRVLLKELKISERLGSASRLLRFSDGAFCEVRDQEGLAALLASSGYRSGKVERWQRSPSIVVFSALLTAALLAAAYRWVLPAVADKIAEHTPAAVTERISVVTLQGLDRALLHPSKLDDVRRKQLYDEFSALTVGELPTAPVLEFRSSPEIGPNAFALPNGHIVLLDELVTLSKNDEEIEGVLAHELGHVRYRHGMRLLVQGSTVAAAMTVWFGDVSALLATVPTALLHASYSRQFESQADGYSIALMQRRQISPGHLADLLERLVAQRTKNGAVCPINPEKKAVSAEKANKKPKTKITVAAVPVESPPKPETGAPEPKQSGAWDYLASHPATDERIRRLREADHSEPKY